MHHAEADELRLLEPGDQPQHTRLLAPFELRLEPDEAEVIAGEIVLPQLHGGEGRAPGARVDETDRLHRPEAQRLAAAMRHHLDRQAALEELLLLEIVDRRRLGAHECVVERVVLRLGERAVEVVALAIVDPAGGLPGGGDPRGPGVRQARLAPPGSRVRGLPAQAPAPARRAEDLAHVDRLGKDDRTDRVVEVQVLPADERGDVRRQRFGCQRPGGDDERIHRRVGRDPGDFFTPQGDQRMRGDRLGDGLGEAVAIDGERRARGHAARVRGAHDEGSEPPHLFFEQADRVIELVAAEGIRAHQLGEPVGPVHGRGTDRAHLVNRRGHAERGRLPRGLGTGESSANDVNHVSLRCVLCAGIRSSAAPHGHADLRARAVLAPPAEAARRLKPPRRGAGAASRRAASSSTACS